MSKGSSFKTIILTIIATALACGALLLCGGAYLYLAAPEMLNTIISGGGVGPAPVPVAATAPQPTVQTALPTLAQATATVVSANLTPTGQAAQPTAAPPTSPPAEDAVVSAGKTAEQALAIMPGQYSGHLTTQEDENWYKFEVGPGQILEVKLTPQRGDYKLQFTLSSPEGQSWNLNNIVAPSTGPIRQMLDAVSSGVYYVQVKFYSCCGYKDGDYRLELSLANQNDANSKGDAEGKPAKGLDFPVGQSLAGQVGSLDKLDCYKFTPAAGQTVYFTPDADGKSGAVQVFNADQQEIWRENPVAPAVTKSYQLTEVAGSSYYLCVAGEGKYTVEVK